MALFDTPLFYRPPWQKPPQPNIGELFLSAYNAAASRKQQQAQFEAEQEERKRIFEQNLRERQLDRDRQTMEFERTEGRLERQFGETLKEQQENRKRLAREFSATEGRLERQFGMQYRLDQQREARISRSESLLDEMRRINLQEAWDATEDRRTVLRWLPQFKDDPNTPPPVTHTPQARQMINQIRLSRMNQDLALLLMEDRADIARRIGQMIPNDRLRAMEMIRQAGGITSEVADFIYTRPAIPSDAGSERNMFVAQARQAAAEAGKAGLPYLERQFSEAANAVDKVSRGGTLSAGELMGRDLMRSAMDVLPYADSAEQLFSIGAEGVTVNLDQLQAAQRRKIERERGNRDIAMAEELVRLRTTAKEAEDGGRPREAEYLRQIIDTYERTAAGETAGTLTQAERGLTRIGLRLIEQGRGDYDDFFDASGAPLPGAISRRTASVAADDDIAVQRLSPQQVRAILANIVPRIDDYVYSKTGLSAQQEEDLVNGLTDAAMSVMEKRGAGAATMTIKDVLDEMNASGAAPGAMGIGSTFEADLSEWLRTNAPPARP